MEQMQIKINWDDLESQIQSLKDTPVKSNQSEILIHYQVMEEIHNLIWKEIRRVIDSFNVFTNYSKEDYEHSTRIIHELMEMIGK